MSITNTSTIFKTNDNEYGYAVKKFAPVPSGGKIKLFIPKVMGSKSKGKETKVQKNKKNIKSKRKER